MVGEVELEVKSEDRSCTKIFPINGSLSDRYPKE